MRIFVTSLSFIIIGLWLNIVFNHYVQIVGLKINWILIFLLIQTFRQLNLGIAFFGILAGLILDALSHGIMGLYGTSFFLTLLITSQIKKVFFANLTFECILPFTNWNQFLLFNNCCNTLIWVLQNHFCHFQLNQRLKLLHIWSKKILAIRKEFKE